MHPVSAPGLLVAAPPTLLRHGLLLTLQESWPERPASLTTTAAQLLAQLHRQPFGLLIIDCAVVAPALLPGLVGQAWQRQPGLPLLLLTKRRRPLLPAASPRLRLLPQHTPPAEVARVVAELLELVPAYLPASRRPRPTQVAFSPRELEVLALVLADLSNDDIAGQLRLSVRTVESHRRTLLQKAGVRTPVGLAVRALREGWVGAADQALASV